MIKMSEDQNTAITDDGITHTAVEIKGGGRCETHCSLDKYTQLVGNCPVKCTNFERKDRRDVCFVILD